MRIHWIKDLIFKLIFQPISTYKKKEPDNNIKKAFLGVLWLIAASIFCSHNLPSVFQWTNIQGSYNWSLYYQLYAYFTGIRDPLLASLIFTFIGRYLFKKRCKLSSFLTYFSFATGSIYILSTLLHIIVSKTIPKESIHYIIQIGSQLWLWCIYFIIVKEQYLGNIKRSIGAFLLCIIILVILLVNIENYIEKQAPRIVTIKQSYLTVDRHYITIVAQIRWSGLKPKDKLLTEEIINNIIKDEILFKIKMLCVQYNSSKIKDNLSTVMTDKLIKELNLIEDKLKIKILDIKLFIDSQSK